ncbi:MAG: adenylate/guanylate cyclase domain-containing protein [Syntrophales bacterium]|nr:adenylate/guanylate cyclase domain-containing protein [Syntrophales bacterium]
MLGNAEAETAKSIQEIDTIYHSFDLMVSRPEILDALVKFEHQTAHFDAFPELHAIINYLKSLFLQKAYYFPRAEQLLGKALVILGDTTEPIFQQWRVRIFISLGYVHTSGCNYIDAETYLNDALNLALSDDTLSDYLQEIYSLLSNVNLLLRRNREAKQFALESKDIAYKKHLSNPSDTESSEAYAHAIINSCRMSRLIGFIDQSLKSNLDDANNIFIKTNNTIGHHLVLLEMVELQYAMNKMDYTLDMELDLEHFFIERKMHSEAIQTGLLSAKLLKKMLNFEKAKDKLIEIGALAQKHHLDSGILMADIYFEIGMVHYEINEEDQAMEYFKKTARLGMVLGVKGLIVKAFKAARPIDKVRAERLLSSDLVFEEAWFSRDRVDRSINPFKKARTRIKVNATTMFLDIVDFTAIMMGSDEDLTVQMIDELIDRICLIIYLHNGYIDKFMGDGVMAIFEHGESISPDVAINAIKCGLDILRALEHKNYKLNKAYGVGRNIDVRIGISTGIIYAVLLGNYIKTEFTYLGNSVNLASKLEQRAMKQAILVDKTTYEMVHENIVSEPQSINIQGIGITQAYKIERLKRTHERQR